MNHANMENKPIRVQRKRIKGWKMPENTVYVGRPTKFGNPYKVNELVDEFSPKIDREDAVYYYAVMISRYSKEQLAEIRKELRGKNLACFCSINQPCHADVLLSVANSETDRYIPEQQACKCCGKDCFEDEKDYYMVKDEIWLSVHPQDVGMLCIDCLESKLGRKLQKSDILVCKLTQRNPYTSKILNSDG